MYLIGNNSQWRRLGVKLYQINTGNVQLYHYYSTLSTTSTTTTAAKGRPQNLIEKIVQKYAVDLPKNTKVYAGDFVSIRPEHVMTHDNTAAVMQK